MLGDTQVADDGPHDGGIVEEREDPHSAVTGPAAQRVDVADACEELRPATTRTSVTRVTARGVGLSEESSTRHRRSKASTPSW